jgi:phage terminase small subunit
MSIRPHDGGKPPTPPALRKWPAAPRHLSEGERVWWRRLGRCARDLGTISTADLGVVERACQASARCEVALRDPETKPTALTAMLRLELDYWKQLGLSPQSRRAVTPLPVSSGDSGFEDIEDDGGVIAGRIGTN